MTSLVTTGSAGRTPVVATHGWTDLFFLHWVWPAARLAPLLPKGLVLDRFDGDAFLTVAAMRVEGLRPRGFPSWLGLSFDELVVRTYVRGLGGRGMYFLDVESSSLVASFIGKSILGLPYEHARVQHEVHGREIAYASRRTSAAVSADGADKKGMAVRATRTSETAHVPCSPLERFLLDRRSVFVEKSGALQEVVLKHPQLQVRAGTAVVEDTSLLLSEHLGAAPVMRPIVHVAEPLQVDVHAPQMVGAPVTSLAEFRAGARLLTG